MYIIGNENKQIKNKLLNFDMKLFGFKFIIRK